MCHRGRLVLALFAGIVMVIGGCTAAQPTPAPATTVPQATEVIQDTQSPNVLAGTAWQLESMLGGEALVPLIQGTAPSLGFAIDRYTGYGGCDWFLGLFLINGNSLQMEAPQKSRGGCQTEPNVLEQQSTYMQLLRDSTRFAMEDGKLVTYIGEDQRALTMVPLEAVPFEGTTWELTLSYSTEFGYGTPGIAGTTITARFDGAQVTGNAGCNDYSADYTLDDTKLTLGAVTVTEKACTEPDGVMDQEKAYLEMLQASSEISQFPRSILLSSSDGTPLLLYSVGAEESQ